MSVREVEQNGDGVLFEVRWRDRTGRHRSRRLSDRETAEAFDYAVRAWQAKVRADDVWEKVPRDVRHEVFVHDD